MLSCTHKALVSFAHVWKFATHAPHHPLLEHMQDACESKPLPYTHMVRTTLCTQA